MEDRQRRLDAVRARSSELKNHLIDELRSGHIGRREFLRRGSVIGMSVPLLSFIASACGSGEADGGQEPQAQAQVRPGGLFRVGIQAPSTSLDPVAVADDGGIGVISQAGEYLVWSDPKTLALEPRLAERWAPNADGSVWTFRIRRGVTFNDGTPMTAEDVAATFNRLADPANESNALSAFKGVLSKGNARAVDPTTVEFWLDAPNGNWPNLASSDNYNAVILPRGYDGEYEKGFPGTGPWKVDRFEQGQGVSFVRNPRYWGRQPNPERIELRFYEQEQPRVLALQNGDLNAVSQFTPSGGKALLNDPNVTTTELLAATHRQVHMRTDREPFADKRVRQAVALVLNRRNLVEGLLEGKGSLGNDSPFAPVFKSTDRSVHQREQDLGRARELLAQAGKGDSLRVRLETLDAFEIPDLAQLMQDDARAAGVTVDVQLRNSATYYEKYWLTSDFGITDYGHRGAPNVYLGAPLVSDGVWNAAQFSNARYDALVRSYTGALDLDEQRRYAREIQTLLLDETPVLFPYFYSYLYGTQRTATGMQATAMSHVDLTRAGLTA